jgi:hypothetical protein
MEPMIANPPTSAAAEEIMEAARRAPEPLHGGPLALLRFLRANHMLSRSYLHLLARFLLLKLRHGKRLQTDGICFICPGVQLEIGRHATLRIGRWAWLGHGTKIRVHEGEVSIGAKTVMGQECTISAFQHVSIGRECIVADRVMLIDFDHGVVEVDRPCRPQRLDRLRRLHPARHCDRRQRDRRDQRGRHQGSAHQRCRRRLPRACHPHARGAALDALGVRRHSALRWE